MSENSFYWDAGVGDAAGQSPYAADTWNANWRLLLTSMGADEGVIRNYLNGLVVAGFGGGAVSVETGAAICHGSLYLNTTQKTFTLTTPSSNPRIDVIVVQKNWATGTIRLAVHVGTEAGAPVAPTLTQNDGILWEIPLAEVQIETDNSLAVTDVRDFAVSPFASTNNALQAWQLIETAKPVGTDTVQFTSIPQTFKHLRMTGLLRTDYAVSSIDVMDVGFNSDTGNNYNVQLVSKNFGAASPPSALAGASGPMIPIGVVGDFNPVGFATSFIVDIFDYTGNGHKTILKRTESYIGNSSTQNDILSERDIRLWQNVAAITQMFAVLRVGDFLAGSKMSLWGLRS